MKTWVSSSNDSKFFPLIDQGARFILWFCMGYRSSSISMASQEKISNFYPSSYKTGITWQSPQNHLAITWVIFLKYFGHPGEIGFTMDKYAWPRLNRLRI
jgi:hypothetical protein